MKKVLFLIHDLGQGGAEKVLVNLINHMDRTKFDMTVISLFGGGVNEQFLSKDIRYKAIFPKEFPGNSHVMKLFSPKQLHKMFVKERYDIEVSYLEGPSARVISGCPHADTKLVSWIHCTMKSAQHIAQSFRSVSESVRCYNQMHQMAFVSKGVMDAFLENMRYGGASSVVYNTTESDRIIKLAREDADIAQSRDVIRLVAVGTLKRSKGYDRLLQVAKRLSEEKYPFCLYILGKGPYQQEMEEYIAGHRLEQCVVLLGYHTNPYKYVSKCDVFVCPSYAEGFSTAATEALIVGTPVCTVEVSGMKEMLGENNEYGIVTENTEEALYQGIKRLLDDPALLAHYKEQAIERGKEFSTEKTVKAVEEMLMSL